MTQNPSNNQHIFLVDDDQEDRELFSEALTHVNQSVKLMEIPSGIKLIEILNNPVYPKPDIIFLDLNMPKLNGIDCLKRIKTSTKLQHLQVVMLSTYKHKEDIDEAYKYGANYYYVKPTRFDNFISLITRALEVNLSKEVYRSKEQFLVNYLS